MDDDDDTNATTGANQDAPVTDTATHPETANPAPASTPPPVNTAAGADAIAQLTSRVDTLEGMVTALVTPSDTTPVRKPWTHRKFFGGRS